MKIVDEEIFGPVVTITPYHSLEEAIDLVNHSKYGLQAGIYTSDLNLSYKIPYLLDVGGVVINDTCCYRADQMPYGGVKEREMERTVRHTLFKSWNRNKFVMFKGRIIGSLMLLNLEYLMCQC